MSSTSADGLTALSSTLLGLSTIAIALRFYARRSQKVPLKTDDWIMVPCLVSADIVKMMLVIWMKWMALVSVD